MASKTPAVSRAAALPFVLVLISLSVCPAQGEPEQQAAGRSFPVDMIEVPGGRVTLGVSAKRLMEIAKRFEPRSEQRRRDLVHKLASELGERTVEVDPFYLHREPVTNEQYLLFVQANEGEQRFPFHWWKEGKPDHFRETLDKAREAFPGEKNARLLYWEQNWRDLPYAIPQGQERHPVTFVDWSDAQAFAGWAGMRLPTEAEWILAATRGDDRVFVWGDEWSEDQLKEMELYGSRNQTLKPVGEVEVTEGPYGHVDMAGQVFEWVADIGYFPVAGRAEFEREFRRIKAEKEFRDLTEPRWDGSKRILKGGSFYQWSEPALFRVGTRAYAADYQTVEGAGFRVAKSMVPARDMVKSRIAVEYDTSIFPLERGPNIEDQIGVERYDLTPDGKLVTDYHALAAVPLKHMGIERGVTLGRLRQTTRSRPLAVGTLMTTEPLQSPELPAGIYTVYFRSEGMPDELVDALRKANSDLTMAEKLGKEPDLTEAEWPEVLERYGITHEEAAQKNAHKEIDFVRVKPGGLKIPADRNLFLLRANDRETGAADFVATLPAGDELSIGSYEGSELSIGTRDGKELLTFHWGVPWDEETRTKTLVFELPLQLTTAPDLSKPWRKPGSVTIEPPAANRASTRNSVGGK